MNITPYPGVPYIRISVPIVIAGSFYRVLIQHKL
jgi:hypothetical protein